MEEIRIIPYEKKYRDDMIFMILSAKDALGRVPRINEDLLDIEKYYLSRGDMFWLALDAGERVVGSIGYTALEDGTARLHRLYVKQALKRRGIGSRLLETAETHIRERGIRTASVHLGGAEYYESRQFYPRRGYREYAPDFMKKEL